MNSQARSSNVIRVFISSTFKDMHAERDHLVTVVYPQLEERLSSLGMEFYDVDLRWGVPQYDADGEKANSWQYCKRAIDETEPFFLCMLGQRYGWVIDAGGINDEEDRLQCQGLSITEMEIRHAVLDQRQRYDGSFFYLRQTQAPKNLIPEIYHTFVDVHLQRQLKDLKLRIHRCGRPVRKYRCSWNGDRFTGLDSFGRMVLEDLWSGVLRNPKYVPKQIWYNSFGQSSKIERLYAEVSEPIPKGVWGKIVKTFRPVSENELDIQARQMAEFGERRLRWFRGRQPELDNLREYVEKDVESDSSPVCVVKGPPGQGKTSLLASFSKQISDTPASLITHFVGATEPAADVRSLLARLYGELTQRGIVPNTGAMPQDTEGLRACLAAWLENYDGEPRIVIIIDAINQLSSGYDLRWLPQRLGRSVRIILSCIDDVQMGTDSAEVHALTALKMRVIPPFWVNLTLLDVTDIRKIVTHFLSEYLKELDQQYIDAICLMHQTRNPLFLLVMLEELRRLGGDDMNLRVPQILSEVREKYPDTVALFNWLLNRLEGLDEAAAGAVSLWCTYMAISRSGMSGRELRGLLACKHGRRGAELASRIQRSIRYYLQPRGPQLDFFHGQLREAVFRRFVPRDRAPCHAEIASYFGTRWPEGDRHALSELPYHLTEGGRWESILSVLCSSGFISSKVNTIGPEPLVDDFERAYLALMQFEDERADRLIADLLRDVVQREALYD